MAFLETRWAIFNAVRLAMILGMAAFTAFSAQAEPAITNLEHLTRAMNGGGQLEAPIHLTATVFDCDTNTGALILQDRSGAELLEVDGPCHEFAAGELVEIRNEQCLFGANEFGICISTVPLLNNDGLHSAQTLSREYHFDAGRYPVRLDWFNQFAAFELEASCVATNLAGPAESANLIHALHADCFEGYWPRLPNFKMLNPAKSGNITNFDIGFRTRDDMVGIRFDGYFDAPRAGRYLFTLRSDDGSRIWVGSREISMEKLATNAPPPAPLAIIGEPMASLDERLLATIEGRINFASRLGKGLQLEICSEQNSASVAMADGGGLNPWDLLHARVRVSGVAKGVLSENRRVVLGRLAAAGPRAMTIMESPSSRGAVLTTAIQVQNLSRDEAARNLPVTILGVVTSVGSPMDHWMSIQDATRGIFVCGVSNSLPKVGELWSIAGHTLPGDFAPVVSEERGALLGAGQLPEPAHPTWNQLVNGNIDVQFCELEGLITGVRSNGVSLLFPEGQLEITLREWRESELKPFDKAVVRIRGVVYAQWNADTHEVRSGSINMDSATILAGKPPPADPFNAPEKTPRGLFLFDAKATPFQRVKVRGQVTYTDLSRVFIENGSGLEIRPTASLKIRVGDYVEAVGYPEVSGSGPLLREALVRKTSDGVLREPALISDPSGFLPSMRVRVEGNLAGQHVEEETMVLQLQSRSSLFIARVADVASLRSLRLGSRLSVTGVCASDARLGAFGSDPLRFQLLVNAPGDVVVLSEPSWWTLQRLLSAVGVLLVTLALAAVWITLLRRQVAQRTLQLQHEIRERERAERQHALETERSRIARDLHDDLGSSLTEINVLASTGQRPRSTDGTHPALFRAIAEKARSLVAALDIIVWAVDPEDNSLQSLADYLSGFTREYLSSSSIVCRFKIPIAFPNATLDGQIRHEALMVLKETLNNIVRHAEATEVEFQMSVVDRTFEICVTDNGKGFDPNSGAGGHGLKNQPARLAKIGGSCQIESRAGIGAIVRIRLPLPAAAAGHGN